MSSQQLVQRLLCSRARVNLQKVRDGFLGERDFPSLTAAASKLAEAKIFIDDSASLSILELRAKARRLKAQQDVQTHHRRLSAIAADRLRGARRIIGSSKSRKFPPGSKVWPKN